MARRQEPVTMERLLRDANAMLALIKRGVVFDGVDGKYAKNHKDVLALRGIFKDISNGVDELEKAHVTDELTSVLNPLVEKTGGDLSEMTKLIEQAMKLGEQQAMGANNGAQQPEQPTQYPTI